MSRFAIALLILFGFSLPATAAPEVGGPAPTISAKDIQGAEISLAALKGKTVVVEWTNPECPFVKKFYGAGKMQELQKAALADGVVWLSINSGAQGNQGYMTTDEAKKVTADAGWAASHYILDADGKIGKAYGAKTTPHMFVINKSGLVVYAGAIDDKESTKPADIAGAKNYVTAALASLKEGKAIETASTHSYGCSVKY